MATNSLDKNKIKFLLLEGIHASAVDVIRAAGYTQIAYEPKYELSADGKSYRSVTGTAPSRLPHPMPISLMVWSGPGSDPEVITVASAYEAATNHRVPPAAFGPVHPERVSRR